MTRNWKLLTVGCLLLVAAATSVAFAAGSGSSSSPSGSSAGVDPAAAPPGPPGRGLRPFGPMGDPQRFAADLAKKLGLPTDTVRSALRSVRSDVRQHRRARGGCAGPRGAMCPAARMRRIADALAPKLHRSRSEVLAAIKAVAKGRVDLAVRDGFLPARAAQRLKSSIDSGKCPRLRLRRGAFPPGPPPAGPPPPGMPQ
jgi:hypothetical protein